MVYNGKIYVMVSMFFPAGICNVNMNRSRPFALNLANAKNNYNIS